MASSYIQVFRDTEEALSREVRRITFDDQRSVTRVVLQDTFDPFTGELVKVPIEPSFYDSSADANHIQYPEFFIKLIKTREDRFTKREVPLYGNQDIVPSPTAPKAFKIVLSGMDGGVSSPGNIFATSTFSIRNVQSGFLLRILNGNNIGTYLISSVTISNVGPHTITLNNSLLVNLPSFIFDTISRKVLFSSPQDLNTIKIGDNFQDSLGAIFSITNIDTNSGILTLGGVTLPNTAANSFIFRTGNILTNSDSSPDNFIIMDPSIPIEFNGPRGTAQSTGNFIASNWPVPIDAYYLIRIDSKERATHIDVLNRVWEEFNPPRTGLPLVVRSSLSADENLTVDVTSGGSSTITVADNSVFNVGDSVFIIDNFNPTRDINGNFQVPFSSEIISVLPNNQLLLKDIVPDTFIVANNTKIVSNAEFNIWMFHFVDHNTKDVEGAQYWVHEFIFWVQVWVERTGLPKNYKSIIEIDTAIRDLSGNIILDE